MGGGWWFVLGKVSYDLRGKTFCITCIVSVNDPVELTQTHTHKHIRGHLRRNTPSNGPFMEKTDSRAIHVF